MPGELTGVAINRATMFGNKVGYLDLVADESLIKEHILERLFIDLVAGESVIKERAAARFNDLVGSTDVVAGEPLLLPRIFRQKRAWLELNKIWRTNTKVKGLSLGKQKEVLQYTSQVSWLFFDAVTSKRQIKQELDERNMLLRKAVEEAGSDSLDQFRDWASSH
ncbi:hypothetical protein M9H77_28191 [Catharanthus roseus]|uniref:Uncharacterized protein n=1 Tax=Catharanthus roseus TaxID=4058 RepID=A0ACC0AEP0_CATRO|nr:hypothetical protein M9H77_28191 [Catharanthus roseus]